MRVILFSAFAGICGTGLGGLVSAALGRQGENMMCWMLSFAGGVMTSIVCFGLIPETVLMSGTSFAVLGVVLGVIVIMLLNRLVDFVTETGKRVHNTREELYHENLVLKERKRLLRSGIIMLLAIALHNIPEGLAIGAGGSYDIQMGTLLAMMIALHNIPEGMAIASPLIAGGLNRSKAALLTALSGAPTLIGGALGVMLGNISDTAVALALSLAGGAMLYVVFGEIIPQSVIMTRNRAATIVTLAGIIVGLLIAKL